MNKVTFVTEMEVDKIVELLNKFWSLKALEIKELESKEVK